MYLFSSIEVGCRFPIVILSSIVAGRIHHINDDNNKQEIRLLIYASLQVNQVHMAPLFSTFPHSSVACPAGANNAITPDCRRRPSVR